MRKKVIESARKRLNNKDFLEKKLRERAGPKKQKIALRSTLPRHWQLWAHEECWSGRTEENMNELNSGDVTESLTSIDFKDSIIFAELIFGVRGRSSFAKTLKSTTANLNNQFMIIILKKNLTGYRYYRGRWNPKSF